MKRSINGYVCERIDPEHVRVEGKGILTNLEARVALGIERMKSHLEMVEAAWRQL